MENEKRQIDYADIVNLGFEISEESDSIFFNEYGFNYKICTYKLRKNIYIDWNCNERTCQVQKLNRSGTILATYDIENFKHLKKIIEIFAK